MPLLDLFFSMIMFFLWIAWIVLVVRVIADIFESDRSGWGKAAWSFFVIFFPLIGVLIYLIANGDEMAQRETRDAAQAVQAQNDYIRQVAGSGSTPADQLSKLADLRDKGVITSDEFDQQKKKILA